MTDPAALRDRSRPAIVIGLATALSRVLGLFREQLFAALVGASAFADAYVAAFRIPNLVRDLVAEGALAQAVVPAFAAERDRAGLASAYQLGTRVARIVGLIVAVVAAALALAAPAVVGALVGDFAAAPGKLELTAELLRVMAGYLPLVALAAVAMAMSTAQSRFVAPALGPALFNVVSIAGALALALAGCGPRAVVIGWAVITVVAGAAQLALQTIALGRAGWRPRLGPPSVARRGQVAAVVRALVPAMIGVAALQLNVFVATILASGEPGAVAYLNYAFRFLQLPLGVFAIAIATVATTRLAEAAARGDRAAMAAELAAGLRWVILSGVPAAVGLIVIGAPIIALLYQHGRFDAADTDATARALTGFALGLPAYAAVKVLAPAWFAIGRARVTMIAALAAVALIIVVGAAVADRGLAWVAGATALAAAVDAALLFRGLDRALAPLPHRALAVHLLRVVIASAVMGAAAWVTRLALEGALASRAVGSRALIALVPVVVGVAVFAVAAVALAIPEVRSIVRRR